MDKPRFKIGDKVLCTDAGNYFDYQWMVGKVFVVADIDLHDYATGNQRLLFNETEQRGHSSARFVPAPAEAPKPDIDWDRVFKIRCKAKNGVGGLTPEEQHLVSKAFEADPERYKAMSEEVFEATKPFGATR